MTDSFLKNTLFISILGHFAVFNIFSFSFGYKVPGNNFSQIYSLGSILGSAQLKPVLGAGIRQPLYPGIQEIAVRKIEKDNFFLESKSCQKPHVLAPIVGQKSCYPGALPETISVKRKKEHVTMFHPRLPVSFLLFFKDRDTVHIELMFKVLPGGPVNSITVKRKISSGNLEADLLCMRYISRYLFLRQGEIALEDWHTVKIDLSAKND